MAKKVFCLLLKLEFLVILFLLYVAVCVYVDFTYFTYYCYLLCNNDGIP